MGKADPDDTITIDRSDLAAFLHSRYLLASEFYPPEEWAAEYEGEGMIEASEMFESVDEARGYAKGNLAADRDVLMDLARLFDISTKEVAKAEADRQGEDTFEHPLFSDE